MGSFFSKKTTRQAQMDLEQENTYRKLSKQTGASASDIKEWHFVFRKQYPRGISQAQFVQENIDAHGGSTDTWMKLYNQLDIHKEGSLSFAQYLIQLHKRKTNPVERRMKDVFRFFDKDGDGVLNEQELTAGLEELYEMTEVIHFLANCVDQDFISEAEATDPSFRAKAMIARFDFDGDNALNEHEFVESCRADQHVAEALSLVRPLDE